ncbi:MAG: GNAT family N-acetyltransferase [Burkholderiaceae bacterium]
MTKLPETLVIRSAEPADALGISHLYAVTGVYEGTLQTPDVAHATRLEMLQKTDAQTCRLVAVSEGAVVAHAALYQAHTGLRRAHVRVLAIAVDPRWQGKGLGTELIGRLLAWADRWAGVLRVELTVHADNERAAALYRRLGFVDEGRHRGYALKDGRYMDALSMARLHPSPPRIG